MDPRAGATDVAVFPPTPEAARARRTPWQLPELLPMPLAGATVLAVIVPASSRVQSGVLAFAVLVGGAAWCRRLARHAALMALVKVAYPCAGALVGVAGLTFL